MKRLLLLILCAVVLSGSRVFADTAVSKSPSSAGRLGNFIRSGTYKTAKGVYTLLKLPVDGLSYTVEKAVQATTTGSRKTYDGITSLFRK